MTSVPVAKMVHEDRYPVGPVQRPWKWTRVRREAMKLLLQGYDRQDVAARLGIGRNTLTRWGKRPEWITEFRQRMAEADSRSRLRRLAVTRTLTDKLGAEALKAIHPEPGEDINIPRAGLYLREHREHIALERKTVEAMGLSATIANTVGPNVRGAMNGDRTVKLDARAFDAWLDANGGDPTRGTTVSSGNDRPRGK